MSTRVKIVSLKVRETVQYNLKKKHERKHHKYYSFSAKRLYSMRLNYKLDLKCLFTKYGVT